MYKIKKYWGILKLVGSLHDQNSYSFNLNGLAFFLSADTLFEIWNKYEPRLPKAYYQEKLLELGDFLMSEKVWKLKVFFFIFVKY